MSNSPSSQVKLQYKLPESVCELINGETK